MGKRGNGKGKAAGKANGKSDGAARGAEAETRATPTARIVEDLFRPYTLEEIRAAGSAVADAIGAREELQVEWKEVSELFKIRREGIDGRIAAAAKAIRGGGVTVPTDCEARFHVPRVGMKQVWRLDSKELVREVEMSVEECQEKLFASQELAELEKMAGGAPAADFPASSEGEKPEEGQAESDGAPSSESEGSRIERVEVTPAGRAALTGASERSSEPQGSEEEERLYEKAVAILVEANAVSATLLQRGLKIAFGRAAQLIERMEQRGVVSKLQAGKRQVILRQPGEEAEGEAAPGSAT